MSTTHLVAAKEKLPIAIFVLTLGCFVIGTTEFIIMGLLPEIAEGLTVSIPRAGELISAYALGVALGGPVVVLLAAKMQRKLALMLLMGVFTIGNALCAIAIGYGDMLIARLIASLGQGAFLGIGVVLAQSMVPANRKAFAVSIMFAGLTIANIVGVPLGTALGHWLGWQTPFWAITAVSALTLALLWLVVPAKHDEEHVSILGELRALADVKIWIAFFTSLSFTTGIFIMFSYVAPMLTEVTKLNPNELSLSLIFLGISLVIGNIYGGKYADKNLDRALLHIAIWTAISSLTFRWLSGNVILAEINWFIWGVVTFAAIPSSQVNMTRFGKKAPNLVSTLSITAFNFGIAFGAFIGSSMLDGGYALIDLPVAAAAISVITIIGTMLCKQAARKI